MKYTPCFKSISLKSLANDYSLDERVKMIRKNTWHKTLVANNTIPSVDAMNLRSERLKFVLENTSLQLQHSKKDPTQHGWRYENGTLQCVWDSEKSNSEIAFMRRKRRYESAVARNRIAKTKSASVFRRTKHARAYANVLTV